MSIEVNELEWDDENEGHQSHGLTPIIAEEVRTGFPRFFPNKGKRKSGTHQMIGPGRSGVLWTIILTQTGKGRWRPITGWPSSVGQIEKYKKSQRNKR